MKKILNPFADTDDQDHYQCFGCSPFNKSGLQLKFQDCGKYIESTWKTLKKFEGFHNVLHGGIQATLLDETSAWVVFSKCHTSGVTKSLKIDYLSSVFISYDYIILRGRLVKQEDQEAFIECELLSPEGKICAKAEAVFFIFPEKVAQHKYNYPGKEAFYDEYESDN